MSGHGSVGHFQHNVLAGCAALFPILEFKITGIRNEVRIPDTARIGLPFAAEIFGISVEAIDKITRSIENKIGAMKEVKNNRHAVDGEKSRGFVPRAVEMLVPRVERQREETSLLPLERLLGAFIIPDGRRAAPFKNVDHIFIKMSLRIEVLARRNFTNVRTR